MWDEHTCLWEPPMMLTPGRICSAFFKMRLKLSDLAFRFPVSHTLKRSVRPTRSWNFLIPRLAIWPRICITSQEYKVPSTTITHFYHLLKYFWCITHTFISKTTTEMSRWTIHIKKNSDRKIKHLRNTLCQWFLKLNHFSSVGKYNPNMNTLDSLAQQVSNTWHSKATKI